MKTLKDITSEQAIEITKMIWGFDDLIKSPIEFNYFDGNYGQYTNEQDEEISVRFDFDAFPEKRIGKIIVHIFPNLDCSIAEFNFVPYNNPQPNGKRGYWTHKHSYPVRNQNGVQKKFIEWGIEPNYFGANKHIVKN
ncbi:MAG: hypothetical protein IPJ01_10135 [Micavibrio sp.]|nr:hypothetical protein [Micavibrio sp.]